MSIPTAYGAEILATAMDVAKRDWRTSVSESTHFDRIAAMDRLRAAIDAGISAAKVATAAPEIPSQDPKPDPMRDAAPDLYAALDTLLDLLPDEYKRFGIQFANGRVLRASHCLAAAAALAKANPNKGVPNV